MGQQFEPQFGADHAVGRRFDGERSQTRRGDPLFQINQTVAGNRGHVDQDLAQHDEGGREQQQTGLQTLRDPRES
jgi:hypothetical protein